MPITGELIAGAAGCLLSLIFAYVPGAANWYERLGYNQAGAYDNGVKKQQVMVGMLVLITIALGLLACIGLAKDLNLALTCDRRGLFDLLKAFVVAAVVNQSTHSLTSKQANAFRVNHPQVYGVPNGPK